MQTAITTSNDILKENFEDFFETSLCGFVTCNTKGVIERANSKVADWAGTNTEELRGKRFADLLSIGGKIYYETHLAPLLRMQGYFDEVVLELQSSTGSKLNVMVNAMERKDHGGTPLFIRFTIVKASDRLLYERNLQQAKKMAEGELVKQTSVTAVREQLIAVLGHDLRNPLAAIVMAVELLEMGSIEGDNREVIGILKRSSVRMSELVNNIMDFAKTRMGDGIVLTRKDCLLKPVLQQIADEVNFTKNRREIITSLEINEPVNCDPHRVGQLLSNLVANAITHGAADSPVYIRADITNKIFQLSVSNSGIPIPANIQQNIFEPFTRESSRPGQQGLGLGLFISKEIAMAHGGSLLCTSSDEETRFTFTLPDIADKLPLP